MGRNIAQGDGFYSLVEPHPWLGDYMMFIDVGLGGYASLDFSNMYWNLHFR